ncbi:ExbD/TolR family protein [Phnomibacter sp. MR]|uniref:ExbD/TolR family protein n=1 Tax=Phnomibacter sp. MR TaxID=3042318 RepID=UPI003A80C55F
MADIQLSSKGGRNRRSTRVDLTAMVDLGFLLITFFIFTTTMSQSVAMQLVMPKDGPPTKVAQSGAVSLLVHQQKVVMVLGDDLASATAFSWQQPKELRQALIQVKQQLIAANGNDEKLFVLIKPMDNSSFGQVINLYDEMTICGIKRYAMANLNEQETVLMAGYAMP